MNDLALLLEEEKTALTEKLSEQYSHNVIDMGEYERLLEYVNKIETVKELNLLKKIIDDNSEVVMENSPEEKIEIPQHSGGWKSLALFSNRTSEITPRKGYGGSFESIFGMNRVIADNLPAGRTLINVSSIFGHTEIVVPKNVRVVSDIESIFGNVHIPNKINRQTGCSSELYITGSIIFGNVSVIGKKN
jgi:hypothetical protein